MKANKRKLPYEIFQAHPLRLQSFAILIQPFEAHSTTLLKPSPLRSTFVCQREIKPPALKDGFTENGANKTLIAARLLWLLMRAERVGIGLGFRFVVQYCIFLSVNMFFCRLFALWPSLYSI